MARSSSSARKAGSRFEREIANYLQLTVSEFIDRRVKTGAKDKGDLANVRTQGGGRVVVECKDYGGKIEAGKWIREAHGERDNDNATVGVVIAKRRGTQQPGEQWVIMTVEDLVQLLTS